MRPCSLVRPVAAQQVRAMHAAGAVPDPDGLGPGTVHHPASSPREGSERDGPDQRTTTAEPGEPAW